MYAFVYGRILSLVLQATPQTSLVAFLEPLLSPSNLLLQTVLVSTGVLLYLILVQFLGGQCRRLLLPTMLFDIVVTWPGSMLF